MCHYPLVSQGRNLVFLSPSTLLTSTLKSLAGSGSCLAPRQLSSPSIWISNHILTYLLSSIVFLVILPSFLVLAATRLKPFTAGVHSEQSEGCSVFFMHDFIPPGHVTCCGRASFTAISPVLSMCLIPKRCPVNIYRLIVDLDRNLCAKYMCTKHIACINPVNKSKMRETV